MNELIKILEEKKEDYEIGIINNGTFFCLETPFQNKKVIKIKRIKENMEKLINIFKKNNILLTSIIDNDYYSLFKINNTDNELLVEYVVKSHVQLPMVLLKQFRTDEKLYYMSTENNKINQSSARTYNREKGYYAKWFEQYLSNNYESIITQLIETIKPFAEKKVNEIELENLYEYINKLFYMALFRNPTIVKEVNDHSVTSILFKEGIKAEDIAITCENISKDILKDYKPLLIINTTDRNFLTLKCLFSSLSLNFGNCFFLPLHTHFGIVMVPNKYYSKLMHEYGNETFIAINDINTLNKINLNVYNNTDVIGKKEDLEILLNEIKNQT